MYPCTFLRCRSRRSLYVCDIYKLGFSTDRKLTYGQIVIMNINYIDICFINFKNCHQQKYRFI